MKFVFGLWEEAKVPGENQHMHLENKVHTERSQKGEFEPEPSYYDGCHYTTVQPVPEL